LSGRNRVPDGDANGGHAARSRRTNFILHFHRFQDQQTLRRLHRLARFNQYFDYLSRHRRFNVTAAGIGVIVAVSTPVPRVGQA